MRKNVILSLFALILLTACNKDKEILDQLSAYNVEMQSQGYHFGDQINLPKEVSENAESVSISFGDKETNQMIVDPQYFTLGDNAVTFNIKKKNGEVLQQDATINVFAKTPEKNIEYKIVNEYPHDSASFVQGFQIDGNTIYESDGQNGESKIWKYTLGSTTPIKSAKQSEEIFSEGATIVGDKVYQLTWRNKIGFIYNKSDFSLVKEFPYPNLIGEGWGLTYDGKQLIWSDGSKYLYFLDPKQPSKVVREIGVAGSSQVYDQLNELEYHNGFVYANVWHQTYILKINPENGEVVGKFDFAEVAKKHLDVDLEHVLNGIAFKGENMLITGKNWDAIYEVEIL